MRFVNYLPIIISLVAGIAFASITFALIPLPNTSQFSSRQQVNLNDPYGSYPCQNVIINTNSNGTFYTCPHLNKIDNIIFDLPPPVYKLVLCTSTYGCSNDYTYIEIVPANLLTTEQKQQILDKVFDLPQVKEINSSGNDTTWKVGYFLIQPVQDNWYGDVQLVLNGIKRSTDGGCGLYGSARLNLETLEMVNVDIPSPSKSDLGHKCTRDFNPDAKNFVMP